MKLKIIYIALIYMMFFMYGCDTYIKLKEEDKIFHAAPNMSGFGGTFFGLYKNNIYEFCDGDFMDQGCYMGEYELNGNILTLKKLKLNDRVKYNRFIIYRYSEQDSTYWQKKYPKSSSDWEQLKQSDKNSGSDGDIYQLDNEGNPVMDLTYYYVIRLDKL